MKLRKILIALFLVLLLFGTGIGYHMATPDLIKIDPPPDTTDVPSGASIRLTFSRQMDAESIVERLSVAPPAEFQITWEGNTLLLTPRHPWPSDTTLELNLAAGARSVEWPVLSIQQEHHWSVSIRPPVLGYLYPSDGPADLYTIDPESGEIERLTEVSGGIIDFSTNFSGSEVYFSQQQGEGKSAIMKFNRLSKEISTLLDCPQALCRYPRVSPDGRYLAYERTLLSRPGVISYPQVWMLPLSQENDTFSGTTTPAEPLLAGSPDHQTRSPSWSSKGLLAYYDPDLEAYTFVDAQGRQVAQVFNQTGLPGDWHPSGDSFIFTEIFPGVGGSDMSEELSQIPFSHLLVFNLSTGSLDNLTVLDNLEDASPAFSPDGRKLAFARKYLELTRWTPGRQLWVVDLLSGNSQPLTQEPYYNHYDFAWSPQSDRIAFMRFNQTVFIEPPEIWLINAHGSQARLLIKGGYSPQWIP